MTFSSASLSDCEVDDVAATAAGCHRFARRRRQGGMLARRRRQWRGGRPGQGATWSPPSRFGVRAADFGTALRAIGRGFGSGTFGLAQASGAMADKPTVSARLVASAVDRNAAARAERVTVFLCGGESFNR